MIELFQNLNENKQNKSFLRDRFNFSLIRCIFGLSVKSSNNENWLLYN